MARLEGLVFVITGSTRGIGRAVAEACTAAGAEVVTNGRATADVSREAGAQALLEEALARHGRVDVWINNAGVAGPDWHETLGVNLTGAWLCARRVIEWAVPTGRRVRIVNVSSAATDVALPGAPAYVASKHGLEGLTRALARDTEGTGVTVTAVKLGPHRTELSRRELPEAAWRELPPPEAAAAAILYAATAPADVVAGRALAGWRLREEPLVEALLNQPLGVAPRALAEDPPPENPWGASPAARQALARARLDAYPDPEQRELRAALGRRFGLPAGCFAVGAGITELLERVLRLFVRPGELVVCADPTWPYFDHLCRRMGLRQLRVPYRVHGARATLELPPLPAAARLVYLVSPANPVGALAELPARVPPQTTLVVDEAYAEYADPSAPQAIARVMQSDARVIVLRTFSKLHGLAGARIGYAVASPATVRLVERLAPPFGVSSPAAAAAIAALGDEAQPHAHAVCAANRVERARMQARLDARGIAWLPSEAPFFLIETPGPYLGGRWALMHVGRPEDNDRALERAWAKKQTT